jgi:hypothetical protein
VILDNKPFLIVYRGTTPTSEVADWIEGSVARVVNCAGERESKSPGIGERVERFLGDVFAHLDG